MLKTLRSRQGFTLIELMIVVVIIGILAALAIPRFSQASDRAKEREADGILKQIYTMQEVWAAQTGGYTADVGNLISVGYEAPTTLKHYLTPNITDESACMAAAQDVNGTLTANDDIHNHRQIEYETGEITNVAACTAGAEPPAENGGN